MQSLAFSTTKAQQIRGNYQGVPLEPLSFKTDCKFKLQVSKFPYLHLDKIRDLRFEESVQV